MTDVTPISKPTARVKATKEEWAQLVAGAEKECQICGSIGYDQAFRWIGLSLHHIVARSQGGDDVRENLATVCGSGTTGCHGDLEARRNGVREKLRAALTHLQIRYVITKKSIAYLDRHYPLPREQAA